MTLIAVLSLACWPISATAKPAGGVESGFPLATNIVQLRQVASEKGSGICSFTLEGTVLAVDTNSALVFLQDDSGAEAFELNLAGKILQPGQRIRLQGTNYVVPTETGLSLGKRPVVDNDGLHGTAERFGSVYLTAGRHPIRVSWFNHQGSFFLGVEYSGPNLTRRRIPDSALFRVGKGVDEKEPFIKGLEYRCFEGEWTNLPDYDVLAPVKKGTISNFGLGVMSRKENVGLEYNGFLQVADSGDYTFYLKSDDGGRLSLYEIPPELTIIGTASMPVPRRIICGQPLNAGQGPFWAEVEGNVTFLSEKPGKTELELASGGIRMQAVVFNSPGEIPRYLQNSQVRIHGLCLPRSSADGQNFAGLILAPDWQGLRVQNIATKFWSAFKKVKLDEITESLMAENPAIVCVQGMLRPGPDGKFSFLEDNNVSLPVELLMDVTAKPLAQIECLGICRQSGTNIEISEAVGRAFPESVSRPSKLLPLLKTAAQVQELTREEAQRGYPVKIRGVVTYVFDGDQSLLIQDSTRAVFVGLGSAWKSNLPWRVGENLEIEGITLAADFSPIVGLRKAVRLGEGQMPPPIQPTRDELLSGSLDAQYVEIRGLVVAVHTNYVTLLTPGGALDWDFSPSPNEPLESLLNALIRVRGCLLANWNPKTHRVILDQPIHLRNASVSIDASPPVDPFEADRLRASELLQFNSRADTFRRVKICGQIIYCGAGTYYLMDGSAGLRFKPVHPVKFEPGDNVEVAGLVELGGASPMLQQAVARKTGSSPLPKPQPLNLDRLSNDHDSTRVWVEGVLTDVRRNGTDQALELQVGLKSFAARLNAKYLPVVPWSIGSRIKLTGTFSALDGNWTEHHDVNSFELLLNSPADVEVLARPPWWTLGRLLIIVSILMVLLALAFIWISLLRRQIERRTIQLKREIGERERAEQGRNLEQERSRIARDLHDDMGGNLTEITMLATINPGLKMESEMAAERLKSIADKSRSMVTALDGLVWAVNPRNDTLSSLSEYLASFVEEFTGKAEIACQVELPVNHPERMIAAEVRHHIFLSVKEILNNAIRHGHPTEVLLRLTPRENELEIVIQDNGCGFDPARHSPGNGLPNLQERMHKLNGQCRIQSAPGNGTTVFLTVGFDAKLRA